MGHCARRCHNLLIAVMILISAAAGSSARGGIDDDDLVEPEAPALDSPQLNFNADDVGLLIDHWVYGDWAHGSTPELKLRSQLRAHVSDVSRAATFSLAQEEKLLLAGERDIRRFADRVEALRLRFPASPRDRDTWNQITQEVKPLRAELRAGLFGRNSLFGKTMAKMLTPDRTSSLAQAEEERRRVQHREGIDLTVARLTTILGLSDEQQTRLKTVLLVETRPGRSSSSPQPAEYPRAIYAQMGRIPEAKLKPLFEPWQWQALRLKMTSMPNLRERPVGPPDVSEDIREPPPPPVPAVKPGTARASP